MKKILLLLVCCLLFSCSKKNTFNDYENFIMTVKGFDFEKIEKLKGTMKVDIFEENLIKNSEIVFDGQQYYLVNDDFESYYHNEIHEITTSDIKTEKLLSNAYEKMVEDYLHINVDVIGLNDIMSLNKNGADYVVVLNNNGSLAYFNDVLKRFNYYVEKGDFISGEVNLTVSETSLKATGVLHCKEGIIKLNEFMTKD